ncbi:MAG: lysophospholipid acyltransferase family protein, partial [Pirellulales bacterium]
LLRRGGAFSIYREGMDRAALNAAIDILEAARRPLVIFPEGVITHHNDVLNALMEGPALIARNAAKKRAKQIPAGQIVVHPVAIKYHFRGDMDASFHPVLDEIETRLSWRPQRHLDLVERIYKVGESLLCLKEMEYLGRPQTGTIQERLRLLTDHLLVPLETEWLDGRRESTVVGRVKQLRIAILPDLIADEISEAERQRRWRQLADAYLAQQLSCYPHNYVRSNPTPHRLMETVERFEEDLTDKYRVHAPITAAVQVGQAIPVTPQRDRGSKEDPLMSEVEHQLRTMIANLQ